MPPVLFHASADALSCCLSRTNTLYSQSLFTTFLLVLPYLPLFYHMTYGQVFVSPVSQHTHLPFEVG